MYPLSKQTRSEIDRTVTFSELRKHPDSFVGTVVVLGGEIVAIENEQNTTLLELLQKRTDLFMRPRDEDATEGRFLVLASGFLDPAVYKEGRRITVAGQVSGKRTQRLGNIDYVYPLLQAKELYLWPDYPERVYYPYPALYFWDTYHLAYPPWL
jgi:outer membrane lipoprotein